VNLVDGEKMGRRLPVGADVDHQFGVDPVERAGSERRQFVDRKGDRRASAILEQFESVGLEQESVRQRDGRHLRTGSLYLLALREP
jgi:hypothetical protein